MNKERLLNRSDEAAIAITTVERPWAFDGDGEAFKLTVEAKRIDLAFLFDPMMAVHTSNVEPSPHQIRGSTNPCFPANRCASSWPTPPGAGKTIMADLYIRELIMRADARHILIVAPGSLVEQWRDEMYEKFGLEFRVFTRELESATPSGNPFDDHDHLIVHLDQMARNDELQEKLCIAGWTWWCSMKRISWPLISMAASWRKRKRANSNHISSEMITYELMKR